MKTPMALFCIRFLSVFIPLLALWSCENHDNKSTLLKAGRDMHAAVQMKSRGSFDSAIVIYTTSADYSLKTQQYQEWVQGISGLIDCYKAKGELDKAMQLINQSLVFAKSKLDTLGNPYNNLVHKKANLCADKRYFSQAIDLYNRNITTYLTRSAVPDTGLALSYNGMGTIFLLQNNYDEALIFYQKAIGIFEKANQTKSIDYANSIQNMGIVHSLKGNYEEAEQYFLRSLSLKQAVLKRDDPQLNFLYVNLGRYYQIIRNDSKALEYLNLAELFYTSHNQSNSISASVLYLNMGVVYIYTAEYEKAKSYLNKSLEIVSTKAPGNLADLLTIYLNMGVVAEKKGDYNTAKEYYEKGLSIGDKLANSGKILRGLANVSYLLNDKLNADAYYKKALQNSIELYGKEHGETALTYLRYGDFLSDNGNSSALQYLNMALSIYKNAFGPKSIDVSSAYFYLGNYYYRMKEYTKAVNFFQNSLIAGYPGFTSDNIADNPGILNANLNASLLDPLTAKANALLFIYQSDTSRIDILRNSAASFDLALKMIEKLRSTYQDEGSKLFISGSEKNTYSNALRTHVMLYYKLKKTALLDEAFAFSEKGKSAVLLSHLRDKEAKSIGNIPEKLLTQDANLKSEIYSLNKQIHDQQAHTDPDEAKKINILNSKVFELSRKQDDLIKSIEKDYPAYYNLKYNYSVIMPDAIQKKLTPNQAIIEFAIADSILYTFAITTNQKQLKTARINSSFYNNMEILRKQLSGKEFNNYTKSDFREFVSASSELYNSLLLPVRSQIKGKELFIIPDGELGYLSFDILLTSLPDTSKISYRKLPYLVKESGISYAPSATTFFDELNIKSSSASSRILAFAPDYGADNKALDEKDENGKMLRSMLPQLQNSQEEVKIIGDEYKTKAFTGKNATETAFKKNAGKYRILHLAMHTIINNENPLYSKLIFYKHEGDTINDGMLNASELVNMELNADMAVLSSCNTGSGKMQKGEGIMSLSRDFFYAGVPGIIMTAWAVEDRTGIKLMDYFYKYIAQGIPRHEALRLAKIEYLENADKLTSHPHYWASYLNVGDISPIKGFGKKNYSFYLICTAFLVISIPLFLLIYRKKKPVGNKNKS